MKCPPSLCAWCDLQRCVFLATGELTGETFPGRQPARDASTGTGLRVWDLQVDSVTIITAGSLEVIGPMGYISGLNCMCLMLFYMYDRNPDHSMMPWCYVRRRRGTVKEFCDIPKCKPDIGKCIMLYMWRWMFLSHFPNHLFVLPHRCHTRSKAFTWCYRHR